MNIGILYVLHGRKTSIPLKLLNIVKEFSDTLDLLQAIGMLEGQQQTLESAVTLLEEQAVEKIVVVPVLLFPATHAREDIPQRMQASASVPFEICETSAARSKALGSNSCREEQQVGRPVLPSHVTA